MLIVGGGLAFTAIGVFFAWRYFLTCRALWRERAANKRLAAKHKTDSEKIGAE